MAKLADFIISRVRVKLLQVFLSDPKEMFYVRQLTRKIEEEINAVRRELQRLQSISLVKSERRGNRLYYRLNPNYLFYQELSNMVAKTTGLGKQIIKYKNKLGFVKYAFMSTCLIRGGDKQEDQVDLMLIGDIIMPQLAQLVKSFETQKEVEVNYSVMTEDEFKYRKNRRDPFILSILHHPRIMLVGNEDKLLA